MTELSPVRVLVEETAKKSFASALDWPGWARAGRTPELAIEALQEYADRYARIASRAKVEFLPGTLAVCGREVGTATTVFGAPDAKAAQDHEPLTGEVLDQWLALLGASWAELDDVVARAPAELVKGPRGGGRDRDEIVRHVCEAERSYGPKLGVRLPILPKTLPIPPGALAEHRSMLDLAFRSSRPDSTWPLRYGLRRLVWHCVDHLWEIEDKILL